MDEITCPYCEHSYDLCHDDGAFYKDGESEKEECPKCGKFFMVMSFLSWDFSSEKADCLNGSDHKWEQNISAPKEYSIGRFTCSECGKEDRRDEEGRAKALAEIYK